MPLSSIELFCIQIKRDKTTLQTEHFYTNQTNLLSLTKLPELINLPNSNSNSELNMPPSFITDDATIATKSGTCSSLKSNSELNLKTAHRIIYCAHNDVTYEGRVLVAANANASPSSPSSSPRNGSGRKKKKRDTVKTSSSASSLHSQSSGRCEGGSLGVHYIKHGKGTIHDHASGMTLSGYFQHNQIVGHALQTLYDPGGGCGGHILAQYEGSFCNNNGPGHGPGEGHGLLRHGKGKFMWHTTNDVYFGEFYQGDMEGMGTFTWGNSGDRYEGPFKRGRMHGPQGKKYTLFTGDVFEGTWRKGQAHGWGRKDFGNGDVFQGYYSRDVRQGYGSYHWQNGDLYIGQWDGGRTSGRGLKILVKDSTEISSPLLVEDDNAAVDANAEQQSQGNISEVYQGEWNSDEANGNGIKRYSNGDMYMGEFKHNMRNGYGVYTWANGDVYEGYFVHGRCHGLGIKRLANGDVLDGEWYDDKIHGYGVKTHARNGDMHMGYYQEDERHGYGLYKWSNGNEYEGDFAEGDLHGFGEYRWESSSRSAVDTDSNAMYRGQWRRGRKDGPGFLQVLVRGVKRVFFDICVRGTRRSRQAVRYKWEEIPSLDQLRSKQACLDELKREHLFLRT